MSTVDAITGAEKTVCRACGLCCRDWKGGTGERCAHLGADDRCTRYTRLAELEPDCDMFPTLEQACDLPEECGYVQAWRRAGLV